MKSVAPEKENRRRLILDQQSGDGIHQTKLSGAQMIQLRDVVVQDVILVRLAEARGMLLEDLLRPRPGRITMREVIGPHEAPHVAHVLHFEGDPVVLKCGVHVFAEILTRHFR